MISELIKAETTQYLSAIDLIAASNAPTKRVRCNADWGAFQFRSAEGAIGRKYYSGVEILDELENRTAELACTLFGAEYANVQPISGTNANYIMFSSILEPGDKVLALGLRAGGHLSHGSKKNLSSELFSFQHYFVDPDTELIDFESLYELADQVRPQAIIAGFSSYPRTVQFDKFAKIAKEVGATLIADLAHIAGLVATGLHQSPVPFGAFVTSSVEKTLRGTRGGFILSRKEFEGKINQSVCPGIQSSIGMAQLVSKYTMFEEALTNEFKMYQSSVISNAKYLGSILLDNGIRLVSGGTDTHQILLDTASIGISGVEAEERLRKINIYSNRNPNPRDQGRISEWTGLRIGTPTVTSRGFTDHDIRILAELISEALKSKNFNAKKVEQLSASVSSLARKSRNSDSLSDLRLSYLK